MTELPSGKQGADVAINNPTAATANTEISERDRRILWSKIMTKMLTSTNALKPYFVSYGSRTETVDRRALVIRYRNNDADPFNYIAITTDGPFRLVTKSSDAPLSLSSQEKDETHEGGYTVKRDDNKVTRTVSLEGGKFTFSWPSSNALEEASLQRANGETVIRAMGTAEPRNELNQRGALISQVKEALQASGTPEEGNVPMWEEQSPHDSSA